MLNDLLSVLYPQLCAGCDGMLNNYEKGLCTKCQYNLPRTPYSDIKDNPMLRLFAGKILLDGAMAHLFFSRYNSVKEVIHQLKYKGREDIGETGGMWLGKRLTKHEELVDLDMIIPLPLHADKLKQRGYNQATSIARGISKMLKVDVAEDAMNRVIKNPTQTKRSKFARWENTKGIFKATADTSGKSVIVVDDVCTTGSTLEAAGHALWAAKAKKVFVVTLAFAGRDID